MSKNGCIVYKQGIQKFEVSKIFLKEINTLIQEGCIKLINRDHFRFIF